MFADEVDVRQGGGKLALALHGLAQIADGADEIAAQVRRLGGQTEVRRPGRALLAAHEDRFRRHESLLDELDRLRRHADVRRAVEE